MRKVGFVLAGLLFALVVAGLAADFRQAEITNGVIRAKLYLPDGQQGYYHATRFDWSGVIASLEYKEHSYFGQWFEKYDPKTHDSISGPVEEFGPLGYQEAEVGGKFVKIGVGTLVKPQERAYSSFGTYEIADPGKWSVRSGPDFVEFTHELKDTAGYAYAYRKTVRLAKDKPAMVLEHSLRNTGAKLIDTNVYEHNFYMLDGKPTGPDFVVRFPFTLKAARDLRGLAEIRGKELVYLQELQTGQTVQSDLTGFGDSAGDYDIRVENRKTGAGVRQVGDRPMARINFWSIRTTVCPEPYVNVRVEPGKEMTWSIRYEFYTLAGTN